MFARFDLGVNFPLSVVLFQSLNVKLCILQDDSEKQSIKMESSLEPDSSPSSPKVSKFD